jgi:DNA mismatch repair protein MLH3
MSTHRASPMFAARPSSAPPVQHQQHHGRLPEPPIQAHPLTVSNEVTFAKDALASARILGQVDNKFICCVLAAESVSRTDSDQKTGPTLVLIDQHAADERVSVERVLRELAEGFISDQVDVTELPEPQPMLVLSREESQQLEHPTVLKLVQRWGLHLEISTPADDAAMYRQVKVLSVPTALKARLGRKEAKEATRLVKLYLPVLHDGLGEVAALIEAAESDVEVDWGMALRWMPKEMLELANSKACRSEWRSALGNTAASLTQQTPSCSGTAWIRSSAPA